jgi:Zn finger protein HypA/HybF involved in hydrogenase expression
VTDKKAKLQCKECGGLFETFLTEMAEQNVKIVCPKCGKTHQYGETEIVKSLVDGH